MAAAGSQTALRSDAKRNRDRIVRAARKALAQEGLDVGVDEIARRAGVGMGTLYRRFPTKELLIQAIFEERLDELQPAVERALEADDPWQGFCDLLHAATAVQAEDQGFLQLLVVRLGRGALPPGGPERFFSPFAELLARARDAGTIRSDVTADDLPVLTRMAGAAVLPGLDGEENPDWPRHVALLLDALKTR